MYSVFTIKEMFLIIALEHQNDQACGSLVKDKACVVLSTLFYCSQVPKTWLIDISAAKNTNYNTIFSPEDQSIAMPEID